MNMSRVVPLLLALISACVAASCTGSRTDREVGLYEVSVESGARQATTGDQVAYDLFIPRPAAGLTCCKHPL